MNKERLELAINVMKRAGKVDMRTWQSGKVKSSESRIHACGTAACFAGWLAISPEFRNSGGWMSPLSGAPAYGEILGAPAVIGWLEAEELKAEVVELLVDGSARILDSTVDWLRGKNISVAVGKQELDSKYSYAALVYWGEYKAPDVIKILEILRNEH